MLKKSVTDESDYKYLLAVSTVTLLDLGRKVWRLFVRPFSWSAKRRRMHHTRVTHFELLADNVERAKKFYKQAFGWDINQYPGMEYHMVNTTEVDQTTQMPKTPGAINGGLTKRNNEVKNIVITVDTPDIDAALKTRETRRQDSPEETARRRHGFTAYFKDTEGNIVGLWQSARRM